MKHKRRDRELRRRVLILDSPELQPLTRLAAPYEAQTFGWNALLEMAGTAPPSSVILVDPVLKSDAGPRLDPRIEQLLRLTRTVPVLAVVTLEPPFAPIVRQVLEMGVTELLDAPMELTSEALRARLLASHAQPLKRAVEPLLSRFVSTNALTLIRASAEVAVDGGTLRDLARIFDSSERTITTWCTREALPPPRRLLAWLRLFLGLTLLAEPQRSVMNAAMSAGYLDYSLRRAIKLFLGEEGGVRERTLPEAVAVFNAELRELRETVRAERREQRAV